MRLQSHIFTQMSDHPIDCSHTRRAPNEVKKYTFSASLGHPNVGAHATTTPHSHSSHVDNPGDYDHDKLICGIEGFQRQFDIINDSNPIDAKSAREAIERIFANAEKTNTQKKRKADS